MTYVNMMPAELAEKYAREKLWLQKTVFDILAEQAAAHPGRVAIKDQQGSISYGALRDRIERAAQFYHSIGIKRSDVVTIQLPNRIDFAVAFSRSNCLAPSPTRSIRIFARANSTTC